MGSTEKIDSSQNIGFLEEAEFEKLVSLGPLVSIDLIIQNKSQEVLLGMRSNEPAKGYWFVPGGRVRKMEDLKEGFRRVVLDEIGVEMKMEESNFIGVFEHFYSNSSFSKKISTHYIVLAYLLELEEEIERNNFGQHDEFRWFSFGDILTNDLVHPYSKAYFKK
jgi:colanic acid biosynthesis protein WcaH